MKPAKEIIDKIMFSNQYDKSKVILGFWDRSAGKIYCKEFSDILSRDAFGIDFETEYKVVSIPYHRLRQVKYDDKIIWERPCEQQRK